MGIKVSFDWHGPAVKGKVQTHLNKNLDSAAIVTTDFIKSSFGDSGVAGKRSGSTKKDRRNNRSKPWGPPNVDTSFLKDNVAWTKFAAGRFTRRIGTGIGKNKSVPYAILLEFGTRFMLPRPWLRPGISKMRTKIAQIIARPMR